MPALTTPPTTGPSLLDLLKSLYGTTDATPDAPTAADNAYAQAAQQADSSAGSAITNGASAVGSAINNGLNSLFNLNSLPQNTPATTNTPDLSSTTGSGAPMGFGGQGGQATDVIPAGLLAAVGNQSLPQPTAAQLAGVVGPASVDPSQQTTTNLPIADPTSPPDVTLDANGNPVDPNATQNLSNTDRESNPLVNQIGLFNQQASALAQNPDPTAAKGLLSQFGDTLGTYAAKLKSLNPAASQGLITAGLSVLAGNNGKQSLTQLLGSGGAAGVTAYTTAKQQQLLNAQAAQKQATENAKFALDVSKAGSEAQARTDNTTARNQEIAIQAQNAQTERLRANAEMNGTAKWVTVQQPDGTYANQGYDKQGNPTALIPASAEDIAKLTATKAPTDGQAKAAGYANRMIQNESTIQQTLPSQQGFTGFWNRNEPSSAQTSDGQAYTAAKNNWIAALLRQESGAAIGKEEYATADQQYFPQKGDSDDVIKQKQALRATAAQGLIASAGPNYKPQVNTPAGQQAPASTPTATPATTAPAKSQAAQANLDSTLQAYVNAARAGNANAIATLKARNIPF